MPILPSETSNFSARQPTPILQQSRNTKMNIIKGAAWNHTKPRYTAKHIAGQLIALHREMIQLHLTDHRQKNTQAIILPKNSVAACGIYLYDQGLNLGPLHWTHDVLATGPARKSLLWIFFNWWPFGMVWVILLCSFDLCAFVKLRYFLLCLVSGEFLSQMLVESYQSLFQHLLRW